MLDGVEIAACVQECKNQHATEPENYIGMALAFDRAKVWAETHKHTTQVEVEWLVFRLADLVLGEASDYRNVQVTINGVKAGADPQDIEHRVLRFCKHFAGLDFTTAREAYKEFELIHPFKDGNGRVGMCLYNVYHCLMTGQWKGTQAPDMFAQTEVRS